jgi:hypothetical protein
LQVTGRVTVKARGVPQHEKSDGKQQRRGDNADQRKPSRKAGGARRGMASHLAQSPFVQVTTSSP